MKILVYFYLYKDFTINNVNIDNLKNMIKKYKEERIIDFINKTKNPYVFKVNGRLVKLEFTDNGTNAEDAITNVIKSLYK